MYENFENLLRKFAIYFVTKKLQYQNPVSNIQRIYYVFKITGHDVKSEWLTNNGLL